MKLFDPDPNTGTLGYVKHSYNPDSIYQVLGNFFICIGPILLGTTMINLLAYWFLGIDTIDTTGSVGIMSSHLNSWYALYQLISNLLNLSTGFLAEAFSWHNLFSWQLYAFIYLAFAIGSSITLSPVDIKGALKGFGVILVMLFIFNLATVWSGDFAFNIATEIAGYCWVFYSAMFLILLLNIAIAGLILLPLSLLRSGQRR